MIQDGGQRIATADGAMLADPAALGKLTAGGAADVAEVAATAEIGARGVAGVDEVAATAGAAARGAAGVADVVATAEIAARGVAGVDEVTAAAGAAAQGIAGMDDVAGVAGAASHGVAGADPAAATAGIPVPAAAANIFEPAFWADRGELQEVSGGRGSAWFISSAPCPWVLRHYRRGGLIARLSADRYVWAGEARVRAFAEWRLLHHLLGRGLPVPAPVAARYRRNGFFYRCDLITRRIPGADSLSSLLARGTLSGASWRAIGAVIARLHAAGADHADLNAHNILLDGEGVVSVIDFDRGRLRNAGSWMQRNLARLRRSLVKVTRALPPDRFDAAAWELLLAGYTVGAARPLRGSAAR